MVECNPNCKQSHHALYTQGGGITSNINDKWFSVALTAKNHALHSEVGESLD